MKKGNAQRTYIIYVYIHDFFSTSWCTRIHAVFFINISVHKNPWTVDVKQKKCHFSTKIRDWVWGSVSSQQKKSFNFLYLLLVQFLPNIFVETCLWMKFVKQKGEPSKKWKDPKLRQCSDFFWARCCRHGTLVDIKTSNLWEDQTAALVF